MSAYNGCVNCLKKRFSLLSDLSEKELTLLNSQRISQNYKKGETIYNFGEQANNLYCLSEGAVKICTEDEEGNSQIVAFKKNVDFIGFHELMSEQAYNTTATAIDEVSICSINRDDLQTVMRNNNDFSLKIIKSLANNLRATEKRIVKLTSKQMQSRLAGALLEIVEIYGYDLSDKKLINIQLKRKDLANFSNMTTANAIRTISSFVKQGILATERRKIWILDSEALSAIQHEDH